MKSVLIVDDDRELCELVAELPADEGFGVDRCDEVLRRLRAEGSSIHVLMLT